MSLNRVVLVGRLTKDVDLRYTSNGIAVSNFVIACNRSFKNQDGEQEADFIQCVAWRKQAENLANYQKKGNMIGIDGRIQTRSYKDQDEKMVYVTEVLAESIQFLESRNSSGNTNSSNQQSYQQNNQQYQQSQPQAQQSNPFEQQGQAINIQDDELPF